LAAFQAKVIYKSKDGSSLKDFNAVDFIASIASHIHVKGE